MTIAPRTLTPLPGSTPAVSRLRILVVDDSRAMRGIVIRLLRQAGFADSELREAASGREALQSIRLSKPDLVLADYNMPEMNGLELLQAARAEGGTMRFGLVSSEALRVRTSALQAGASFVLSKPLTVEVLKEALSMGPAPGGKISAPSKEQLSKLLADLLGGPVQVIPSIRVVLAGVKPVLVGLYELDSGAPAALLACDLDFAAAVASAMAAVDPAETKKALDLGKLSDELMDNAQEFFNVAAALFNSSGATPVSLRAVHGQLRALPPRAVAMAIRPTAQLTVEATVPKYGAGALSVIVG